jgi:hypothetical protein
LLLSEKFLDLALLERQIVLVLLLKLGRHFDDLHARLALREVEHPVQFLDTLVPADKHALHALLAVLLLVHLADEEFRVLHQLRVR